MPDGFPTHDYRNMIEVAAQNGVGVLNIRVLAAGAIVGQEPPGPAAGLSPGSDGVADMERGAKLREALGDAAGNMAQTSIRHSLMNPKVSGVLVGFSQIDHVEQAVAAVDMGPLDNEILQKLDSLYASDFGRNVS